MTTTTLYAMASGQPCLCDYAGSVPSRVHFLGRSEDDGDGAPTSHGDPDYQRDTSYHHQGKPLNADAVPFAVCYPQMIAGGKGVKFLGCRVRVTKLSTGKAVDMVCGDIGPRNGRGEVSDEGNRRLGNSGSPNTGGDSSLGYMYEFFPGVPAVVDGIKYSLA